jgi:DTW domain-containing protein YfiP
LCAHLHPIETRTRLVILQHPRERRVAIGTAHIARLCLTRSELHVGVDWDYSSALARSLADPERPAILLYPGEGAIDIVRHPPPGPVTLVVVDGTWSQTKKMVRRSPLLASLPRYAFVPPRPSEYRIRKEPDAMSVATIEAVIHALTALEGAPERFARLLDPFRAMIEFQIACEQRFRAAESRHAKWRSRPRRMRVPRVLTERLEDVVCVTAEANAWPHAVRVSNPSYADELVQWAAYRPATGETMSFIVRPRGAIAPGTTVHTGLDEAMLRTGETLDELYARWRAFARETDVVCSWGAYPIQLFERSGGWLPNRRLDLRGVSRDGARGGGWSLGDAPGSPATAAIEALVPGRAGRKLRSIADIVAALVARAAEAQARP